MATTSNRDMTSKQRLDRICSILSVGLMRHIHAKAIEEKNRHDSATSDDENSSSAPKKNIS